MVPDTDPLVVTPSEWRWSGRIDRVLTGLAGEHIALAAIHHLASGRLYLFHLDRSGVFFLYLVYSGTGLRPEPVYVDVVTLSSPCFSRCGSWTNRFTVCPRPGRLLIVAASM